jgi:tetratricopeptide (TPR) repeat protein
MTTSAVYNLKQQAVNSFSVIPPTSRLKIEELLAVLEEMPETDPMYYAYQAHVNRHLGFGEQALACLAKAEAEHGNHPDTLETLAYFHHLMNDDAKAEQYLLKAIDANSENPHVFHALSVLYYKQGPEGYPYAWEMIEHSHALAQQNKDEDFFPIIEKQKQLLLLRYDPTTGLARQPTDLSAHL